MLLALELSVAMAAQGLPKDEMRFLAELTKDTIEASRVYPGSNGGGDWPIKNAFDFPLIPPGKDTYKSYWVRDFAMSIESGFITNLELKKHLWLTCKAQNGATERLLKNGLHLPPWSVPDHVNYDGKASFFPGSYNSGDDMGAGGHGRIPPMDDHYDMVHIAYVYWKNTKDASVFADIVDGVRVYDRLVRAFDCPTIDTKTGLCQTTEADRAIGFGFCDGETHTGKLLYPSLLRYRAAGQLAEISRASGHADKSAGFKAIQKQIQTNLVPTFGDEAKIGGWLRASTEISNQADVWGTLIALHLNVLDRKSAKKARDTVADAVRRGTITLEGGVRQVPTDLNFSATTMWERSFCPLDTYQNGGYWHVTTGWLIEALWKDNRELAIKEFTAMMKHFHEQDFRKGGGAPWEVFGPNGTARQNPIYMASIAMTYGVLKGLR